MTQVFQFKAAKTAVNSPFTLETTRSFGTNWLGRLL